VIYGLALLSALPGVWSLSLPQSGESIIWSFKTHTNKRNTFLFIISEKKCVLLLTVIDLFFIPDF
jgi:hypothetical protein